MFTTSSPCELCAKKIKDVGIEKIYYIEQYKGISKNHIIASGGKKAEYILFNGAVGEAYNKLYTPIMPYKDEIEAMGYSPVKIHKDIVKKKPDDKKNKKNKKTSATVAKKSVNRPGEREEMDY